MPSLPSAPARSPWRFVHARVHVSLTPQELTDPEAHAARHAYRGLLLRHHHALNGVAVAHATSFRLDGPPVLIGASPFAHVAATAKLLVFSPPPGTLLTGVVSHVGPDHVGLAVHSVFHAVLPLTGLSDRFRYVAPDRWRPADAPSDDGAAYEILDDTQADDDIVVGSRIRFAVASVKPTESGLFQMLATLEGASDAHLGPLSHAQARQLEEAEEEVDNTALRTGADDAGAASAATVDIELDGAARRRARRRSDTVGPLGAGLGTPSLGARMAISPARDSGGTQNGASQEPSQRLSQEPLSQEPESSQAGSQTPGSAAESARKKRRRVNESGDSDARKKKKEKRGKKRSRESDGGGGSSLADAITRGMAGRRRSRGGS